MTVYFAQSSSNINAANVWNTAANGSGSYLTWPPASGDVLMANNKTITVNVDTNLGATGEVRNSSANGATSGGYFDLLDGVTLTANIYAGGVAGQCVRFNSSYPATAAVVGAVTGGSIASSYGVNHTGSGILTVTGNIYGGSVGTTPAVTNSGIGVTNIIGTILGGSGGYSCPGALNTSTGTINVNGTVTGGPGNGGLATGIHASAGTVNINGNVAGNTTQTSYGVYSSGGSVNITGNVTAGTGLNANGVFNNSTAICTINGFLYQSTNGDTPVSGRWRFSPAVRFYARDTNLVELALHVASVPEQYVPSAQHVRYGTRYALGALIGTCHVPAAASVLYGVPIDATTGTATLTAADIRAALGLASANLDTQLDALPTAAENASAVRSNLATELAHIDANISSRSTLTAGDIPAGLTAQQVWEYVGRTLTANPGVTAQEVWEYLSRTITGGTVDTLTNAPDVPTGAEIADAVRTELEPELATIEAINDRVELQVPNGPLLVVPAPQVGQTTAWTMCYDEHGVPEQGVNVYVRIASTADGASGAAFDTTTAIVTSDATGLATVALPRRTDIAFQARRGNGSWKCFSGQDVDEMQLPILLG